ncbi:hypothetical protein OFR22_11275 [Brachyspira hyodysenteriae]|uniref:hypothetical protein n=1 Tax=Brachyspira hyodysenteriae TaxID=159 RepID=UPI0022CD4B26|nr:hypothetical protein [Brachyspira hyodysenteriae]MCZ9850657.1 hypothetical protein [Brachyspira hyodysenteriae]MCZ9860590.1 hypothetical protein [Brachyspira hyodysenteriae]MCZ9869909.1 hypothetical protein [Brachyspira hyodysenteriae]MCZ9875666.1 hypothetical protein [Brachyspira hyodysenteriae]MCZ9879606.1 hypothetical protein [Brachyspira hyodysenteriae]
MNKFILALMLSIVMLILCAANTKSDKKIKVSDTASIDIKNNSYSNIDEYVMVYSNDYILSKINLYFCFYIWGFTPYPTSFVATYEVRLRREAKRLYLT